jgi:proteic killer suppression protein
VEIRSFAHKGLKKLYVEDSVKGLPRDAVDKLRAMLTYLQDMQDPEKLRAFPLWNAHQLTGIAKEFGGCTLRATGA